MHFLTILLYNVIWWEQHTGLIWLKESTFFTSPFNSEKDSQNTFRKKWRTEASSLNKPVYFVHLFLFWVFVLFFIYYCVGWGYLVAYTKVLLMYQLFQTWIHSRCHSPLSSSPDSWNSYNKYHYCNYMHVYTIFANQFILNIQFVIKWEAFGFSFKHPSTDMYFHSSYSLFWIWI
jgi:hypothetical protein